MIKGYVDGKLFITSDNAALVKWELEEEVKHNFATEAIILYPNLIFNEYSYENGKWKQVP